MEAARETRRLSAFLGLGFVLGRRLALVFHVLAGPIG